MINDQINKKNDHSSIAKFIEQVKFLSFNRQYKFQIMDEWMT